tara:strand:- start:13412 stop:13876 length:465 start_codon:yes stop_codon:yes gene_type:complete
MIKINIISNNKTWRKYIKNPSKFIQIRISQLNKRFKKYKKNTIFCTLLLSGNSEIKKLNKKFRKRDKTTDVLSFPFYKKRELYKKLKKEREIYLGDIIININKIQNKSNNSKFKIEFNKLWIHGLIHLFGYDHKIDKDYYKMKKIEEQFFSYLN